VLVTFATSARRTDAAWPCNHTWWTYNDLSRRKANVLAQLRTGVTPLYGCLNEMEMNLCDCREAVETREQFIFHCARWSDQRKFLGVQADEDNVSRLVGGKSTTDNDNDDWKPEMNAVRAVSHFTLMTKRFGRNTSDK
jgi:hypothetical protein